MGSGNYRSMHAANIKLHNKYMCMHSDTKFIPFWPENKQIIINNTTSVR